MNNYSGAGIAIFEYYNNHKDRKEDSVILFRDEDGTYCLPGGKTKDSIRDSNSTIRTAKEETIEETCCMFNVSNNTLMKSPFYDKVAGRTFYRCYAVKVAGKQGIMSNVYHQNRKNISILYQSGQSQYHDFLETDDIVRVYIRDIPINSKASNGFVCPTAKEGKIIVIKPRDSMCLQHFIRNGAHRQKPIFVSSLAAQSIKNGLITYNV